MNTQENAHILDNLVEVLRKGADELEKFQIQISLGKMEAFDAYEEMKKKYAKYTHEAILKINEGKEMYQDLLAKLQELQVQFNLGKAETLETYEEQRKKILTALHEVQSTLRSIPYFEEANAMMLETLERIKVKLDLLTEQFKPAGIRLNVALKDRKDHIEKAIKEFREKFDKPTTMEDRMENFQKEMTLAYEHLRKAFIIND